MGWILLAIFVLSFGLAAWRGAPYLPVLAPEIDAIIAIAELRPGQTIIDLGCGDGRLLKAAAKMGVSGVGYEINPLVYLIAQINCLRYRRLIKIHLGDFWLAKWAPAEVVFVFLIGHWMTKLDQKLTRDLIAPTKVVSYVFDIPGRKPIKQNRNTKVYIYP